MSRSKPRAADTDRPEPIDVAFSRNTPADVWDQDEAVTLDGEVVGCDSLIFVGVGLLSGLVGFCKG